MDSGGWSSQPNQNFGFLATNRKYALSEYKEMEDSPPTPLLEEKRMGGEMDGDQPYRSMQQLKKTMNQRKRVIKKGGLTNVTYKNISKKKRRYISDLYTTLLDSPWSYLVVMFAASFYISWMLFALIYYIISYMHGDFSPPVLQEGEVYVPCILEIDGFSACFLFSLETQHTIGYGSRQTTTKCPDAVVVMSLQSVLGCLIQAFMVGLVFSKLSRPSSRSKTVIFSQNAVINVRNQKLSLIFRIGDLRDDNFILGTQISAKLMRRRITKEGELFQEMQMLKVEPDTADEPCIFFVWPLEIVHVIDEESPLYDMSATDMTKERFEIIIVMEGTIETSSMTFQARTSYLPNEILWGHRFEPMTLYRKDHNKFQVNFSAFHSTYEVETPLCSSHELDNYTSRDHAQKQQRPKVHLTHLARGLPSSPSTILDMANTNDHPGIYQQEAFSNGGRGCQPGDSPHLLAPPTTNTRPMSLPHQRVNQLTGSISQLIGATNQMILPADHRSSLVAPHRPRGDSETSTDSSVEQTTKKKKRVKSQLE